jgi:hypothetical protein
MRVENTPLIDFPTLSKRQKLRKRVQLEHNWNIAFSSPALSFNGFNGHIEGADSAHHRPPIRNLCGGFLQTALSKARQSTLLPCSSSANARFR